MPATGIAEKQLKIHIVKDDSSDKIISECAEHIEGLIEPNPRKLKNFLNSLCASAQLFNMNRVDGKDVFQRFIIFTYLRLYHSPVWRILERQPNSLPVLHRVLTRAEGEKLPDESGLDDETQTVLKNFFFNAFSHVLSGKSGDGDDNRHGAITMERAVELFEQRLDRKRSDEKFVELFLDFVEENYTLDTKFLSINIPG